MAHKLHVVSGAAPAPRRRGRPRTRLISAVDGSEREMLVVLRRKLAAQIDAGAPVHALAQLVRQLRAVDRDVRAIDERGAATADDDDDDTDDEAGWDPSKL